MGFEITYKEDSNKIIIYNEKVQEHLLSQPIFTIIKSFDDEIFDYDNGEIVVQTFSKNVIIDEIQKWLDVKGIPLNVVF